MDIYLDGDTFIVSLALPDVSAEDIDVSVTGRTLTIRGQRAFEDKADAGADCNARAWTCFSRSVTLPCAVDAENIEAKFLDGLLQISLPKLPEPEGAKRIAVASRRR